MPTNSTRHCEFFTGRRGRSVLDEIATRALSRRKPGPIYPVLVPPRDGPRLFAGEAFTIVCHREAPCSLLAVQGATIAMNSRASRRRGAIDRKGSAGDERRLIRDQEEGGVGDLFGLAGAAHRVLPAAQLH